MATTDSNDLVLLEATDNLVPLQTTINGVTASISTALNNSVRTFKAASESARNTLATKRTPSATNPLVVWRTDKKWWDINDGSGWKSIHPDSNKIVVNGVGYQRSGRVDVDVKQAQWEKFESLYRCEITIPGLPALPNGYVRRFVGAPATLCGLSTTANTKAALWRPSANDLTVVFFWEIFPNAA